MRKLSESVWGDIRKKSLGQEVRTETPIGDYSFDQFYKYLKDNYVLDRDDRIKIGRDNTGRHITATIFIQNKNRVELTIGEDPSYATCLDIIRTQPFEENVERRIRVFTDLIIRVEFNGTKIEIGHETKYLIDRHKDRPESRNSIYLRVLEMIIIGLTLQTKKPSILCIKRQEGKEFLGESVWGDLRKKSLGQEERIENDINNLSPNEFWKYLREAYEDNDVGQTGTLKYQYGIKRELLENVFVITIPFSAFDMVYAGKHYKLAQRLYLKINNNTYKYEDVLISNKDPKTKETLVKNDYGFEERPKPADSRVCPPEGKTMTNRMIIDIIDLLLSNTEFPMLKKNEEV